jgi:DNA (cytosine-5)-methyltransferase 1
VAIAHQLNLEIIESVRNSATDPRRGGEAVPTVCPEQFSLATSGREVLRRVSRNDGAVIETAFPLDRLQRNRSPSQLDLADLADASFLRTKMRPRVDANTPALRVVDLFSGCGVMSLGVSEAARALRMRLDPITAVDVSEAALGVFRFNFPGAIGITSRIEELLNGAFGKQATAEEARFVRGLRGIDLLIGGPPCQGHSNLNNHTRRNDPKNRLYERMARFAELARPRNIIVENVQAVLHDRGRVVDQTIDELVSLGYSVDHATVEVSILGVAQRRTRHVLIASLAKSVDVKRTVSAYSRKPRSARWAIGDLERLRDRRGPDAIASASLTNQKRMAWLFKHDQYDLPDRLRPKCHREKDHSYKSVYGRMHWDAPAQTVTSGFTSMGQGRFVHPSAPRTITPHEAARLQFIPDYFIFGEDTGRTALAEMIGNAVPTKLTYVLALELLR